MSKKYPSGAIPQHKKLATGGGLCPKPTGNSGKTGFEKSGDNNPGKISKNSGSRK